MTLQFNECAFSNGLSYEEFRKLSLTNISQELEHYSKDTYIVDGLLYKMKNGQRFVARVFFKKQPNGSFILSQLRLGASCGDHVTIFPRKEDQDLRFNKHLEIMESLLGEPSELTEQSFLYQFEDGYVKCDKIESGSEKYTDGYLNFYFN